MRLQEMLDRQAAIRTELADMDTDPTTTEEQDGDIRDTLIDEYEQLEELKKPVIARMEKIRLIKTANGDTGDDAARDPAYAGAGQPGRYRGTPGSAPNPDFMQRFDPFADLDRVRDRLVRPGDMIARSMNAIELHNKRGILVDERAEEATRKCASSPEIARHALMTGYGEYIEAFREYLTDPMGEGLRAAQRSLTLGTASGGYLLPYVLDHLVA